MPDGDDFTSFTILTRLSEGRLIDYYSRRAALGVGRTGDRLDPKAFLAEPALADPCEAIPDRGRLPAYLANYAAAAADQTPGRLHERGAQDLGLGRRRLPYRRHVDR